MGATAGILTAGHAVNGFMAQQRQAGAVVSQANFDAQLAELTAKDAVSRGNWQANQREIQARRTIGAQRAAIGASGVTVDGGTAIDLQTDEAKFGELDALMIRTNAAREALGYRTQSQFNQLGAQNEAAALRQQSYSTLLTGAANTYGIYRDFKGNRATPSGTSLGGGAAQLPAVQRREPRNRY